eukprot:TRINITY_DN15640_c0_g1_i1.p1 TRINITY_DN15640_c0_g1~~TRINITY_DN15640_c0_g1_i1.p1  ORF type:complete len:536 (-),score=113.70 TRINITY_DN15640_c0_g1_i1:61-1668(-)
MLLPNQVEVRNMSRQSTDDELDEKPKGTSGSKGSKGVDKKDRHPSASPRGTLETIAAEKERRERELKEHDEYIETEVDQTSAKIPKHLLSKVRQPAEHAGCVAKMRWMVFQIICDSRFDAVIGVVIFANSACIGWQADWELKGIQTDFFEYLDIGFMAVYILELAARFFTLGFKCLESGWVVFDAGLVALGIISMILLPILTAVSGGSVQNIDGLAPLMVLRVLRILKLARALRLLVQFKTLWMLVKGLLTSYRAITFTFLLMFLILYVFACMAVEIITKDSRMKDDAETAKIVDDYFSSITVIMLTLVQFVTMDSIAAIYTPLVHKNPYVLTPYFVIFLLVVSVALMNLVTAVIVEGSIQQGKEDKEVILAAEAKRIKTLIPVLKELFAELDADGGGTLSLDEVINAPEQVKTELAKIAKADDLPVVFELLDTDGGGELDVDEFCEGLLKMVSSEEPLEFIRMRKQLASAKVALGSLHERMEVLRDKVEGIEKSSDDFMEATMKQLMRIEAMVDAPPRPERRASPTITRILKNS